MLAQRGLRAQNYKSIKSCDVRLGPLAMLVGPNGSGKSNFLDVLRVTSDSLVTTLDHALRDRGGINEVLHPPPSCRSWKVTARSRPPDPESVADAKG